MATVRGEDGLVHQVIFYTREAGRGVANAICGAKVEDDSPITITETLTCLDCAADNRVQGGHAVLALGRDDKGAVLFQNSWGEGWGTLDGDVPEVKDDDFFTFKK